MTRRALFGLLTGALVAPVNVPRPEKTIVLTVDNREIARATTRAWIDELHVHQTPLFLVPGELILTRRQALTI